MVLLPAMITLMSAVMTSMMTAWGLIMVVVYDRAAVGTRVMIMAMMVLGRSVMARPVIMMVVYAIAWAVIGVWHAETDVNANICICGFGNKA